MAADAEPAREQDSSADVRAREVEAQMTDEERFSLLVSVMGTNPVLPVRACMTANVVIRFVLLYGVPIEALDRAAADISAALADGALTELPVHRYGLSDIVARTARISEPKYKRPPSIL